MIVTGTLVAGLLGLAVGYLTLRMRGVFFAIATLALSVVLLYVRRELGLRRRRARRLYPAAARRAVRPAALHTPAATPRWC